MGVNVEFQKRGSNNVRQGRAFKDYVDFTQRRRLRLTRRGQGLSEVTSRRPGDLDSYLPGEYDFSCGSLLKSPIRKWQNAHDSCLLAPLAPSGYEAFLLKLMFGTSFKLSWYFLVFPNIHSCLLSKSPASRARHTARSDPGFVQLWGSEVVVGNCSLSSSLSPSGRRSGLPCISAWKSPPQPSASQSVLLARNRTRPRELLSLGRQLPWLSLLSTARESAPSVNTRPWCPSVKGTGRVGMEGPSPLPRVGKRLPGTGNGDMKLEAKQRHQVEFSLAAAQAVAWHGGGMRRERQTGGRLWTALPTMSSLDDIPGAMGSYWRILSNKRHNQIWVF